MKTISTKNFKSGLITSVDSREIPRGAVSSVLNWMIYKDKVELVRGIYRIGSDLGNGKVNSLFFTKKADDTDVGWAKIGRKLYYYTDAVGDWTEIGTDFFSAAAEDDEVSFANYVTNQGNQVWMSSENSSLYKIMTANPADPVDQYNSAKNFKGRIDILLNRMFLWGVSNDKTAPYGSYIDNLLNSLSTLTPEATISIASPCVVTVASNGLLTGSRVIFTTTGALPTGITASTSYYARVIDANTFNLYDTLAHAVAGGATGRIDTSGTQSGTHTISYEEIIGAGGSQAYAGTLAFKAGGAKRTCFAVTFSDGLGGGETFTDDYAGHLTGSAGGSGTINYATGAYSITFHTIPTNPVITAVYQWEDSTNKGVADFTKSATRVAGEGFVFRQDDAGPLQNIKTYNDIQYCLHSNKTYKLNIGSTDTDATNRIYRESVGIPNWRAACATGDGIYYIDSTGRNNPRFRILTLDYKAQQDLPVTISLNLDLSPYIFDKGIVEEFYDYIIFVGRTLNSPENDVSFIYHKIWKNWTILDYPINCTTIKNGLLLAGDTLTKNIFNLFSGFDYNGELINNSIEFDFDDLDVDYLKKVKRLPLRGFIQRDQSYKAYLDLDNSGFIEVGEVLGTGDYVDRGTAISVGNTTIGNMAIGTKVVGDSKIESVNAYYYETILKINTSKFEVAKLKLVAQGIGYVSLNSYDWKDIRLKSQRTPQKYR